MPALDLTFASGESSLAVSRFAVQEGVSSLFTVTVWALSDDASIDLDTIVGKDASFHAASGAAYAALGGVRHWAGICEHMALVRAEPTGRSTYQIRIVPRMWLLTQRRGHRIFQHLSVPDIVDKILAEWSIEPAWNVTRGRYPKLEYKVQYGESDYDFLCRLLEEAGIAFTFPEDADDVSKLTFADALQDGDPRAGSLEARDSALGVADRELATQVHLGHDVRPGAHAIRDYDFRNPSFALLGRAKKAAAPEDRLEQFEYLPGAFLVESPDAANWTDGPPAADDKGAYRHDLVAGDELAQRSLDGERIQKRAVAFEANTVDLWPGMVFSIENHPHPDLGEPLLVTGFFVEGSPGEDWHMSGNAVFNTTPYRPPATIKKPRLHSVQSATVVGPSGQEIHTDELGRVRVQFPWDREGTNDENSSVWIRVAQGWAGTGFGLITIPRVGQEVLIGFLDGDPDQPVVVGRLFNKTHPVPYKLPDNKTRSGWKTDDSPGSDGWNEMMLEDLAGSELVYQQAERNLRRLVKNDETITVVNDRDKGIARDETDTTIGNRVEETDKDRLEQITEERTTVAEKKLAQWIKKDEVERTLGTQLVWVGKDQHLVVKKTKRERDHLDLLLHVKGSRNESVGGYSLSNSSQQEKIGKKDELETGLALHEKAGTVLVAEGASSVTIKGPGGFISIGPAGIDIVGTLVMINDSGSAGSAPDAKPAGPAEPKQGDVVPAELKPAPPATHRKQPKPAPPPPPPPPPPAPTPVNPLLKMEKRMLVVRKLATNPTSGVKEPYTTPGRRALKLSTDAPFDGDAKFDCPGGKVKFFTKDKNGIEIKLDGTDNVFKAGIGPAWSGGAKLSDGVTIFAEGASPSGTKEDITATLTLTKAGTKPLGPKPASVKITCVEVTLDICKSRPAPATDPPPFTQDDKVFQGRTLLVQDKARRFERAQLIIQKVKPDVFKDDLVLTLTAKDIHVTAFKDEKPAAPPTVEPSVLPFTIAAGKIPVGGQKLWAQGMKASGKMRDSGFNLGIKGVDDEGDKVTATAVQIQLDICHARTAKGVEPTPLSADDKLKVGRFVHEQDLPGNHHGRALLIVRKVVPEKFDGTLRLESFEAAPTTQLFPFANEKAKTGDPETVSPHDINYKAETNEDKKFWVQGKTVSGALLQAGYVLHLKDDPKTNADKVVLTVCKFTHLKADIPSTPPLTPRAGNAAARSNHEVAGTTSNHWDRDDGKNKAVALVEGSVLATDDAHKIQLSVTVAPAGVPVSWAAHRDNRPAPDGDHADLSSKFPAMSRPKRQAADHTKARMIADGVGTFHVMPFVDCNGADKFDFDVDVQPYLPMNFVIIRVQGKSNASATGGSAVIVPAAPTSATGVRVLTGGPPPGNATPANAAVVHVATVTVIGGGKDGQRGLDRLLTGWGQHILATPSSASAPKGVDIFAQYRFQAPAPPPPAVAPGPVLHRAFFIFTQSAAANTTFMPPPAVAPVVMAIPVLDVSRPPTGGTGGNTATGQWGGNGPRTALSKANGNVVDKTLGQEWTVDNLDSPATGFGGAHPGGLPGVMVAFRFNINFRTDLLFWTNFTGAAGPTGDPADNLYSSVQTNTWTVSFSINFNPTTGAPIGAVPAVGLALTKDGNPARMAKAVEALVPGLEVRSPAALTVFSKDATA